MGIMQFRMSGIRLLRTQDFRMMEIGIRLGMAKEKACCLSSDTAVDCSEGRGRNLTTNPEDITDPTTAMNMALALMAKAFKLNYSTPTNNNQRISSNPRNRQIAQPGMNMGQDRQMLMIGGNGGNQFRQFAGQNAGNLNGYNEVQTVGNQVAQNPRVQNVGTQNGLIGVQGNGIQHQIGNGNLVAARAEGNAAGKNVNQIRCYNCRGLDHYARNCTARPRRRDAAYLQIQLLIAQKKEAGIQLQAEEYDLMAAAADLDKIEEVNANCILMANLQQASSSGTQTDSTPVYDSDGSAEIRCYNCRGIGHYARNCTARPRRRDAAYLQTQLLIAQKEEEGIQLQAKEYDLMAVAVDLDDIEEVNANCILMANLQQTSTSGIQTDKAPVYDSDGSAENTELLEPIPKPHQVLHNDSNVISEALSVEQGGGTVEQHPVTVKETRAYHELVFHNLAAKVEKIYSINHKMK
nr:hypothetical protein [Tanacetum cinerariifolium]